MTVLQTQIADLLKTYLDPYLKTDLFTAKAITVAVDKDTVKIYVKLGFPAAVYRSELIKKLAEHLQPFFAREKIQISVDWEIVAHAVQPGIQAISHVKNIVAVASGKGGVGKSTTAVNLALALHSEGARVGILDADIYGPNQPQMLGVKQKPASKDGKSMEPVMAHGLQSMSIGYFIETDTPIVWRGPMVTSTLQQLLNNTCWDNLDYLIIDLPPGTGDIQLTLAQKIPVSGAVIVTTPQDIALLDVRKGIGMFNKVNVPVLGIIENMSLHTCSQCGHTEHIFGEGGGERIAQEYNVDLLGALPLALKIREQTDQGNPTVAAEPEDQIAGIYRDIARKVAAKLSLLAKNYAAKFPKITIENR